MIATLTGCPEPYPARPAPRLARRRKARFWSKGRPHGSRPGEQAGQAETADASHQVARPVYAPLTRPDILSAAEQNALAVRVKAGDLAARDALILANQRLVTIIARRYYSFGATLEDLIQEGTQGLIKAAERFEPETHNTRFSTYAMYWIKNSIQRAVAANFSLIRMPDYLFRLSIKSRREAEQRQCSGESALVPVDASSTPTADNDEPRLTSRQLELLDQSRISRSSYYGINEYGEPISLEDIIADPSNPEEECERIELLDEMHAALASLTPLEAWLIRRRYGLDDPQDADAQPGSVPPLPPDPWTYTRLGRALGISVHLVRKLERTAMEKLRTAFRKCLS